MESEKNFQQFEEKSQEGDKILQQAEESVLERNEQYVARRLADAALKSLGYSLQSRDGVPISSATTPTEHISSSLESRSKEDLLGMDISVSEMFDEDELFESRDSIDREGAELSQAEIAMQKFMRQELLACGKEYHDLIHGKSELEVAYMTKNNYDSRRGLDKKLEKNQEAIRQLAQKSPEGYYVVYGNEFRSHINEIRNGNLVTTPYVKENLEHLEKNMAIGQPTFIHGHLGGGKTELAITAAKQSAIRRAAYEEAVSQYYDYIDDHQDLSKKERRDFLASAYRENVAHFEKALHDGDPKAEDAFRPLIVTGSKDLTTQDLFVDKTLELVTEGQAFGTVVKPVEQAIYRGVKEGRPVIIDEVNLIPAGVLMSLNDVLQRRPGDSCYIPGAGTTKIKPGFSITMTGNLSSNTIDYSGTESFNPAFESRLDVLEYDYLPMSENDRSYKDQLHPEDNELFQVIVASLADRQGNLRLPEVDKSLEKVFSLCQLAHETQRIFSGKWRESDFNHKTPSGDEIEPRLERTVLSVRNIMRVINTWDQGEKCDLDKALWDGFIRGISNPDDQNLILILAKQHGFFQSEGGWNVQIKERGASLTSFSEIHPDKYEYQPKDFEVYSYRKVVEALYGPAPKRELYPDLKLDELASLGDDEFSEEDIPEYETKQKEILKAISALEVLGEQCGCNTDNNSSAFGGQW